MRNLDLILEIKRKNLQETEIVEIIMQIEVDKMNLDAKILLCEVFRETEHILVANSIALIMEEFPSKEYKMELLNKYLKTSKGFRGTLLFAMTSYDYSEFLDDILDDFIINGVTDEEAMSVYDIFLKMNFERLNESIGRLSEQILSSEGQMIVNTLSEAISSLKIHPR